MPRPSLNRGTSSGSVASNVPVHPEHARSRNTGYYFSPTNHGPCPTSSTYLTPTNHEESVPTEQPDMETMINLVRRRLVMQEQTQELEDYEQYVAGEGSEEPNVHGVGQYLTRTEAGSWGEIDEPPDAAPHGSTSTGMRHKEPSFNIQTQLPPLKLLRLTYVGVKRKLKSFIFHT